MVRTYFNGVGQISSNGNTVSFIFNDTYELKSQGPVKKNVIELITELEVAEGAFEYLLSEIKKIKSLRQEKTSQVTIGNDLGRVEDARPPIGSKINMFQP